MKKKSNLYKNSVDFYRDYDIIFKQIKETIMSDVNKLSCAFLLDKSPKVNTSVFTITAKFEISNDFLSYLKRLVAHMNVYGNVQTFANRDFKAEHFLKTSGITDEWLRLSTDGVVFYNTYVKEKLVSPYDSMNSSVFDNVPKVPVKELTELQKLEEIYNLWTKKISPELASAQETLANVKAKAKAKLTEIGQVLKKVPPVPAVQPETFEVNLEDYGISSSFVKGFVFRTTRGDLASSTLDIKFSSGLTTKLLNVPWKLVKDWLETAKLGGSIGSFYNNRMKGVFKTINF